MSPSEWLRSQGCCRLSFRYRAKTAILLPFFLLLRAFVMTQAHFLQQLHVSFAELEK
uniref:Uncharacterized protein n=1 Tax=Anguilla anguilla TaxID=7936 RepID=A0A0E9W645_ANGAN